MPEKDEELAAKLAEDYPELDEDTEEVDDSDEEESTDTKETVQSLTAEQIAEIASNAAREAVKSVRQDVSREPTEVAGPDIDALLGEFEYESDKATARKAINVAVTLAVEQAKQEMRQEMAPYTRATQGRALVEEVSKHETVSEELAPYVEKAAAEFGLQATTLNATQAKAVVTMAKGLRSDDTKTRVVSKTGTVNNPNLAEVQNASATPEDTAFEKAFGKGSAKDARKRQEAYSGY